MLLRFGSGVMNLLWIAAVALLVLGAMLLPCSAAAACGRSTTGLAEESERVLCS
jgi:predicted metal-binding membrane protein